MRGPVWMSKRGLLECSMEGHTSSILSGFTAMVETEKYSWGGSKARLAISISPLLAGHMVDRVAVKERRSYKVTLSDIYSLL